MRNFPYVASPCDPGAEQELVGFTLWTKVPRVLLHPISRSETWRRLMFLQVHTRELLARSPIPGSPVPGGRVDFGRNLWKRIDNNRIVPDPGHFLKPHQGLGDGINVLFTMVYKKKPVPERKLKRGLKKRLFGRESLRGSFVKSAWA